MKMKKSKDIELERNELNALIGKGFSFEVLCTTRVRRDGLLGLFRRRERKVENLKFRVQEPTLAVLDLLAAEQLDLDIDEGEVISPESALPVARKYAKKHARRLAKITALAVLGEDYILANQVGSRVRYEYDEARLTELTDLFFRNVKPSKLHGIVQGIALMQNLGDFTNSIRLMSANRTTMPIRVEENKKG